MYYVVSGDKCVRQECLMLKEINMFGQSIFLSVLKYGVLLARERDIGHWSMLFFVLTKG